MKHEDEHKHWKNGRTEKRTHYRIAREAEEEKKLTKDAVNEALEKKTFEEESGSSITHKQGYLRIKM